MLGDLCAQHGNVISATVIMDRATGRSKGFGFVEMDDKDADEAIAKLNGCDVDGRNIKVSEARPQERSSMKTMRY
jgi:cold-inducible RNA-binding protein